MNDRRQRRWPLCLLAIMMALCIGLSMWMFLLHRVLTDEALYREAALTSLPQREDRFEADIRALAEEGEFDAELALSFYPAERRAKIVEEGAAWALSLFSARALPQPDTTAVRTTENGTETLQNRLIDSFPGSRFKAVNKADELSVKVERIAAKTLLPFRATFLRIAEDQIGDYRNLIGKLLRYTELAAWVLAGLALLCGLLLCLVWRFVGYGVAYAGAGLAAGGLGGASIALPVFLLDIPSIISEVSAACAEEVSWIIGKLMGRHLIVCGILFGIGLTAFVFGRIQKGTERREV